MIEYWKNGIWNRNYSILKNAAKIDFFKQDARCQMLDIRQILLNELVLSASSTLANWQIRL